MNRAEVFYLDISAVKIPIEGGGSAYPVQPNFRPQAVSSVPNVTANNLADKPATSPTDDKVNKKPVNLKDVSQITSALNQFVEAMNTNIRFVVHQKTNELMVQVVDQTNNKVLKEFPSKEFLDTITAIRNYVGMLLDKKI